MGSDPGVGGCSQSRSGCEYAVHQVRNMETIQVVLDSKLLRATDVAARSTKLSARR
jgi:hypothetical protein